ncbi:hypothetical protein F5Y12DRAFT_469884 [Xylaria sp. FL1777]|nr:hypothetical protein F5Y12DRAFT_469884 [Xylaria sp. FL1777]
MEASDKSLDPDGDLLVILLDPIQYQSSPVAKLDDDEEAILPPPCSNIQELCTSFKASSQHLALASVYFRKMLSGSWHEATKIYEDGLRRWTVRGFSQDALTIVLDVIHGKNLRVPQNLELNMLFEVARIVDYLQCYEAVALHANLWIRHLEAKIEKSYNGALLHWICIASTFREDKIFERCTRIAITEAQFDIPTLGFPVLARISDEINLRRMRSLDEIFEYAYGEIDNLTKQVKCSYHCDALRLGVLTRHFHGNFHGSRPTRPYLRQSVASVFKTFQALSYFRESGSDILPLHCDFVPLLVATRAMKEGIQGLNLKNYLGIYETQRLESRQVKG